MLDFIKRDRNLQTIPTVVLTSSDAEADVLGSYLRGANAVLRKRFDLEASEALMRSIDDFWFSGKVKLPNARPAQEVEGVIPG